MDKEPWTWIIDNWTFGQMDNLKQWTENSNSAIVKANLGC